MAEIAQSDRWIKVTQCIYIDEIYSVWDSEELKSAVSICKGQAACPLSTSQSNGRVRREGETGCNYKMEDFLVLFRSDDEPVVGFPGKQNEYYLEW